MLESSFEHPFECEGEPYQLRLPKCRSWSSSKKRVLVILQSVDGRDLKARGVLGDKLVRTCFVNAIKHMRKICRTYKPVSAEASYTVVNYNAVRHLHMRGQARKQMEAEFAKRVHKIIADTKPTHILVSGDEAMATLFPAVTHSSFKRGWVHSLKVGELDVKVTSTLDFSRLLEKDGLYANLLGFWCRHLCNLQLGYHPHSLKHVTAKPRYVDTIEKFDRMMDAIKAASIVACDTETKDLSVLSNKIYTIQFATPANPELGYVVPLRHPMTPWTKDELRYIMKKLRAFFAETRKSKLKELVFFHGMFDLRVIRRAFKLPIIWHKVWEITSGEHGLDENIVELNNFGTKAGNLNAIYCTYENDFYIDEATKFTKKDRTNVGNIAPNDKHVLMYEATDVVALLAMMGQQKKMAEHQDIEGRVYRPYFERHMQYQMSDTAHQLSHMREDGSKIDVKYLRYLTSPDSPIRLEIKKLDQAFRAFPQAQEANSRILSDSGFKAKGLFGARAKDWAIKLSKPAHLKTLFFEVMGLEPVSQTKSGEDAVDKEFVAAYKDKNPIVATYGERKKLTTLLSSYAKGWLKKLRVSPDSILDHFLRPDYSSFDVATGRLASKGPSLHTIPSRGSLAKIIKRMFITTPGYLLLRYDYSAHEVRVWSYVGLDKVLAAIFRVGQELRQAFIADPSDANRKAVKEKGDIHILNVKRLLNKVIEKSDPLRDAIKAIIFGLIYGKSAATLGEDTKLGDKVDLMKQLGDSTKSKAELRAIEAKLIALLKEDRTSFAQGLIDRIFKEFKRAGAWTNRMKALAETSYIVYSPIGRVRHLFAAMTGDPKIVAQQVRRGSNAPIQGFASEIGVKAARLISETYNRELPKLCELLDIEYDDWALRIPCNRMVHDASYYSVPYAMIVPFTHILQWGATYGVTKAYKDEFDFEFTVEPEIEIEIGARDDKCEKWDWSLPSFINAVVTSVNDAHDFGLLEGEVDDVLHTIFAPWRNKKCRAYLQEKFPLLDVADLEQQIKDAIRPVYKTSNVREKEKEAA